MIVVTTDELTIWQ